MNKEKGILIDYMDACELIKETEEDIRKLRKQEIVYDKVKGSNPEFPYQAQSFNLGGVVEHNLNEKQLRKEKRVIKATNRKCKEDKDTGRRDNESCVCKNEKNYTI